MPAPARPLAAFCSLLAPFTPMLFMGEEYGESAPFQFFCDHIDKRIAQATRRGRREEFSAFASFGHEIPDPQSVETFLASKLSRERDAELSALYAELLAARAELPSAIGPIDYDEPARWLRVGRGEYELLCNFSGGELALPARGRRVRLATHTEVTLKRGTLSMPALSGALLVKSASAGAPR
jgi:maltooligosyltrehalose trehalohydrolase